MIRRILVIFLLLLWDFYVVNKYGNLRPSEDMFLWILTVLTFFSAVTLFINLIIDLNKEDTFI